MNEHITQLLEAYHDGELRGSQLERVEAHLKSCADCRANLTRLESLSVLLAESPAPAGLKPAAQFEAEVNRRIPARPTPTLWGRVLRIGWYLTPAALLGALSFLLTTHLVGWLATAALRLAPDSVLADLFAVSGWASPRSLLTLDIETLVRSLACGLTGICPLGLSGIGGLLAMLALSALYLSWLASWVARRSHHQKLETITARSRG